MIIARAVFALLAVVSAAATLSSVVEASTWIWLMMGLASGYLLITVMTRSLLKKTAFAWVSSLAGLLFGAVFILRFAAPSEMMAKLIPTPAALAATIDHLHQAGEVIRYQPPPVRPDPGLVVVILCAVLIVTALVELLAIQAHAPALAAIPLISLWTPAIALARDVPVLLTLASLLSWLGLLTLFPSSGTRHILRLRRGAVGLGASALIFGLVTLVALPAAQTLDYWDSFKVEKNIRDQPGQTIGKPLVLPEGVQLSHILGERSNETVLRYRPMGANPSILRLRVMSEYSDGKWHAATDLQQETQLPQAPSSDYRTDVRSAIEVEHTGLIEQFGISPGKTVGLSRNADQWRLTSDTNELIRHSGAITRPYQVVWQPPQFTSSDLREAADSRGVDSRWLQVPEDLPESFYNELLQARGDAEGSYETAVNIQDWFRTVGEYKYEVTNDQITGSALDDFFITRTGFCVHYATAMTLMLRQEGIPARVAVGFLPGKRTSGGWIEVAASRAHAWPEVYFEGHGWVRFEPTPAEQTGRAPQWARSQEEQPTNTPSPTQTDPSPSQEPSQSPSATSPTQPESAKTDAPGGDQGGIQVVKWVAIASALIGAIGIGIVYGFRARQRSRQSGSPIAAWHAAQKIIESVAPGAVEQYWRSSLAPGQIAAKLSEELPPETAQTLNQIAALLDQQAFEPKTARSRARRDEQLVLAELEQLLHRLRSQCRADAKN